MFKGEQGPNQDKGCASGAHLLHRLKEADAGGGRRARRRRKLQRQRAQARSDAADAVLVALGVWCGVVGEEGVGEAQRGGL